MILSPHCDDAVFACGQLLARHPGAVVITVFAGRPESYGSLTSWDDAAGFRPGDDVVAIRRQEDRAALAVLGAIPVWLEFRDSQYGPSPSADDIAYALEATIVQARPKVVIIPLGLFHSDHVLAHDAGLRVGSRQPALEWLAYEDAIYRTLPGLVDDRLDSLKSQGWAPARVEFPLDDSDDRKDRAVRCYTSQLRAFSMPGFPGYDDVRQPERYWRLTSPR